MTHIVYGVRNLRRSWLVAPGIAAALLVPMGLDNAARTLGAFAFAVTTALCLRRARRTPDEAAVWRRLALGSGLLATATATKAVLLLVGTYHQPWTLLPTLAVLGGFPALYGAVVRWTRGPQVLRDNHAVWTGVGAVAIAIAWLEVCATYGGPLGGWGLGERLVLEVPLAACAVLLLTVLVGALGPRCRRDPRIWLFLVTVSGLLVIYAARFVQLDTQSWAPLLVATGAVTLGLAARVGPRSQPSAAHTDPSVGVTIGSHVVLLQVLVVLTLSTPHAAPVPVALAVLAATTCGTRLFRNLRDLSALAGARREASTDELTGTANRRALLRRIEAVTGQGDQVCLAVLDIDDFGTVNDGLGQQGGDELLVAVARRIQTVLKPTCLLGRLGGDDFAVVAAAPEGEPATDPVELGERLAASLAEPFVVGGLQLHLSASIGLVATTTDDGLHLFARAEAALRESKQLRSGPVVHDPARHGDASGNLRLVEELRRALVRDELVLFLQPQLDVATGAVDGVEALVRWQHPERGLLGPFAFIPVAEKHGLIGPLTERVLELAIGQLEVWRDAGTPLRMSVNLSASNLLDEALPDRILSRLLVHGVEPSSLVLEITENVFVGDSARVRSVLDRLAGLGCVLSIDDYGTGYSSLGYLRQLPVGELKLDRSYTSDLLTNHRTATIVGSTINLAHDLGLRVVAEGVEDVETRDRLAELGCDLTQGYWHARPMPAAELTGWLSGRAVVGAGGTRQVEAQPA